VLQDLQFGSLNLGDLNQCWAVVIVWRELSALVLLSAYTMVGFLFIIKMRINKFETGFQAGWFLPK
jgi:hypothetical protein